MGKHDGDHHWMDTQWSPVRKRFFRCCTVCFKVEEAQFWHGEFSVEDYCRKHGKPLPKIARAA